MKMYYRKNNGYTIDKDGNIIRWDSPRCSEDEAKIQELESQLCELRQKVKQLETEQKMMEINTNDARAASIDIENQGALDTIRSIKKEIDSIFKG